MTGPQDTRSPLLEIRKLSKAFAATLALNQVSIAVDRDEIHAVVGENGSGKSTLVKILAGYHRPDSVEFAQLDGAELALGDPAGAEAAGMRFVHQDLGLVETLSVAENVLLLDRRRPWIRPFRWGRLRGSARQALAELGYEVDVDAPVADLSSSERTAVAIARALVVSNRGLKLLVLDEPTAAMPKDEVQRLFAGLRRLRDGGISILFISHHLEEVQMLADRVTVFRDGKVVAVEPAGTITRSRLLELMLGRKLASDIAKGSVEARDRPPVLTVADLRGATIRHLSFDVAPRECIGFVGLTGSGVDEVAELLGGAQERAGQVVVDGVEVPAASPRAAIRAGLVLVPANRGRQAMLGEFTLRENLTVPRMESRRGVIPLRAEREEAGEWLRRLSVRPPSPQVKILTLSGGNQQKVILARALRLKPKVIVLHEPTQGVDVGAKAEIHELLDQALLDGAALIVCSSDPDELVRLCGRVVVLREGEEAARLEESAVESHRITDLQLRGR